MFSAIQTGIKDPIVRKINKTQHQIKKSRANW